MTFPASVFVFGSKSLELSGNLPEYRAGHVGDLDIIVFGINPESIPNIQKTKHPDHYYIIYNDKKIELTFYENEPTFTVSDVVMIYHFLLSYSKKIKTDDLTGYDLNSVFNQNFTLFNSDFYFNCLTKRSCVNFLFNRKTILDYYYLSKKHHPLSVYPACGTKVLQLLTKAAKERHKKRKISLNVNNDNFFGQSKSFRRFDHDSLHKAIKVYDCPLYQGLLVSPDKPLLSKTKFDKLKYRDKIYLMQEEATVLGVERYLIPRVCNGEKISIDEIIKRLKSLNEQEKHRLNQKLYFHGLIKTIHVSTGWFQDFVVDRFPIYDRYVFDAIRLTVDGLENGTIQEQKYD